MTTKFTYVSSCVREASRRLLFFYREISNLVQNAEGNSEPLFFHQIDTIGNMLELQQHEYSDYLTLLKV